MATVDFLHFCDHAFFDSHGQPRLISIHGSDLYAFSFPVRIASLTVAVGLRIAVGETVTLRLEIGPAAGKPARWWPITTQGPPNDWPQPDVIAFLPFRTLSLYFAHPQTVVARIRQDDQIIGEKTLRIALDPKKRESGSPLGAPPPDPNLQ